MSVECKELAYRLEGTVQYATALQETLTNGEIAGLERDMIVLLAQIKVRK